MSVHARLQELGLTLPEPAAPIAAYVPVVVHGHLAHVSGQLPFVAGELVTGRLGETLTLEEGKAAAQACALMILAQLEAALIPLDRIERVVKLTDQPKVANGASELLYHVLGAAGRHARSAVGVTALPLGAAVEVDAIVAVRAD